MSNYRPITCLSLLWKLLAGIVADEIYNHLKENDLLPEEQKGYDRNSRSTNEQLLMDKTVIKNGRKRKVRLIRLMIWYPIRGLKNPWKCVELQITYLIFCPRVWKAGKQS